eukprot:UN22610
MDVKVDTVDLKDPKEDDEIIKENVVVQNLVHQDDQKYHGHALLNVASQKMVDIVVE